MEQQTIKNTRNIRQLLHPSFRQDLFHPTRFLYAIVFASLFAIIGFYLPKIYFQYLDHTDYYKVEQPVPVNQEIYKPCDSIIATIVRSSSVSDEAHSTVQLYLVNENTLSKSNPLYDGNIVVERGLKKTYFLTYKLPCNLTTGGYYIQAVITYHISGVAKTYLWVTDVFTVDKKLVEKN